jgi:hypothetical protein
MRWRPRDRWYHKPAVPTLKGSYDTAGIQKGCSVGNNAYVASGDNGLVLLISQILLHQH